MNRGEWARPGGQGVCLRNLSLITGAPQLPMGHIHHQPEPCRRLMPVLHILVPSGMQAPARKEGGRACGEGLQEAALAEEQ